ncbi:MAG: hypothetical protein MGG11_02900 [Trichodesmium sp. MAG_R03]|nr:hypothetical protein [Trichodesmium sp. MAG_R03]
MQKIIEVNKSLFPSGGSRSMERFQPTANLLTLLQTCRRQGLPVIEFLSSLW